MAPSNAAASVLSGSPAAPELPPGPLSEGSQGPEVKQLQAVLIQLGYLSGKADGGFGPRTKQALTRFQTDWRLEADGTYGPATCEALTKALVPVKKPAVVWRASPNFEPRHGVDVDVIVLHHTGSNRITVDLATLRDARGSNRVSAHYLIAPGGTVYQLVADAQAAWHAGVSSLRGETVPSVNARSIGIEITNDGTGTPFTEAQYRALERLVPYLARTYRVPKENILGHRDVAPGRKTDPADYFDWARVRRAVDAVL